MGHDIMFRWIRLDVYIKGKLLAKLVQPHRSQEPSSSFSTNQRPVFGPNAIKYTSMPMYLRNHRTDFDAVKSKVGLFNE